MKKQRCEICKASFGIGHPYRAHLRKHIREALAILRELSTGQGWAGLGVMYDSATGTDCYTITINHERDGRSFRKHDEPRLKAIHLIEFLIAPTKKR